MDYTPDSLRALLNKLLPLDEFDYELAEVWHVGHIHADAWEATETTLGTTIEVNEQLLTIVRAKNTEFAALRERLEAEREVSEDAISEWKEMEPDLRKRLAEARAANAALRDECRVLRQRLEAAEKAVSAADVVFSYVDGDAESYCRDPWEAWKEAFAALASQEDTDAQA